MLLIHEKRKGYTSNQDIASIHFAPESLHPPSPPQFSSQQSSSISPQGRSPLQTTVSPHVVPAYKPDPYMTGTSINNPYTYQGMPNIGHPPHPHDIYPPLHHGIVPAPIPYSNSPNHPNHYQSTTPNPQATYTKYTQPVASNNYVYQPPTIPQSQGISTVIPNVIAQPNIAAYDTPRRGMGVGQFCERSFIVRGTN